MRLGTITGGSVRPEKTPPVGGFDVPKKLDMHVGKSFITTMQPNMDCSVGSFVRRRKETMFLGKTAELMNRCVVGFRSSRDRPMA